MARKAVGYEVLDSVLSLLVFETNILLWLYLR
jgi:hypothetical protein